MTDKQMHWALRRVAFWALFLIAQYCLVAGFAWRWVLGLTFPLWKLLVIGAIQGFCAFLGSAIFPRATPSEVYLHRKADWESAEKARTKKTGSAVDVERLR